MHACLPACLPACLSLSLSQVPGLPGVDPGKYDALIAIRMTALMRSAMSASAFADDKQSLAHLFWFGDEVDVVGLVADWAFMTVPSLTASAIEEIEIAIQRYEADYFAGGGSGTRFQVGGWGGIRASGAEQSRRTYASLYIHRSISVCLSGGAGHGVSLARLLPQHHSDDQRRDVCAVPLPSAKGVVARAALRFDMG